MESHLILGTRSDRLIDAGKHVGMAHDEDFHVLFSLQVLQGVFDEGFPLDGRQWPVHAFFFDEQVLWTTASEDYSFLGRIDFFVDDLFDELTAGANEDAIDHAVESLKEVTIKAKSDPHLSGASFT